MAKFLLIDQSLRSVGGHPCDYALHVLQAVERQGFSPILVTHREFCRQDSVPNHWEVLPGFRHSSFSRYALCSSGTGLPPVGQQSFEGTAAAGPGVKKPFWGVPYRWHHWRRQAQLRHFDHDCAQVFAQYPLESGDHVFFSTVSEFDFLALSRFLKRYPAAKAACWHLQFHFGIYEGRPAEYERQQFRADWVRSYFQEALRNASGIDLRFYNTSNQLADQYNQLGMVEFQALPYPINPAMQPPQGELPAEPLRVTCGGGFRQEKGHTNLAHGLSDVWDACFASGRMQLQIQAKRSKWRKLHFPQTAAGRASTEPSEHPAVKLIPHPLGMEDYVELIRESHIGLLMYDSRRYYARRAGVLCEFLCAGVPVIVPAGCWLSEQIAESGFEHLDKLCCREATTTEQLKASRFTEVVDGQLGMLATTRDVPAGMGEAILSVYGKQPAGSYLRITMEQFDSAGQSLVSFSHVVGRRAGAKPARAMWRIDPLATHIRLALRDAFDQVPANCDVQLDWLPGGAVRPLGSVGLIAADEQHFGRLLREIGDHYHHYRQSALLFSQSWRREHDPMLTSACLTGNAANAARLLGRVA